MTDEEFEQTKRGTYTEPFTHTQYGVFHVTEDGLEFVGAALDRNSALVVVDNYNRDMELASYPVVIRTRAVTYATWDDGGEEIPDVHDAVVEYHNER